MLYFSHPSVICNDIGVGIEDKYKTYFSNAIECADIFHNYI